jgi:nucleoside phosphorylase
MPPASIAWGFGIHNRGLEAADEQYANIAIERALRTHHCCTLFLLEVEHLELLVQLRHLDLRRLIFSSIGKALSGSLPDDTFISGAGWTEILVVVPGQHLPSEAEQVARTIAALVPNHADDEHSDHPRIYFRVTLRWAPMSLENARRRERFPTTRWTESPLAPARAHLGVTRAIIAAADDDRRDTECTPVEAKAIEIAKTTPPFPPTAPTPSPSPSAPVSSNLMTTPAALQLVDLGIIVALQQETGELLDLAGDYTPHGDGDMNSYLFTRSTYRCAVTFVGAMGEMEAARITERHIGLFDPESVISIGISGGVHDDLRVGDVYVPTQAVQYIQGGKASPTDDGGFIIRPGADVSRVDDHLHTETIGFKFNHKTAYRQWRDDCRKDFEALLTDPAIRERLIAKDLVRRDVALLAEGHEASGPVVSGASAFSAWIQSHDRNVKAVDMECAAVVRAAEARKHRKRALVIRGISDYGDPRKKELDAIGGGSLRKYAMRNAVRLLWALLDAGTLPHHTR